MNADSIRRVSEATPFRRFRLRTSSGYSFDILHPELIHISPAGDLISIFLEGGGGAMLDSRSVNEIEFPKEIR